MTTYELIVPLPPSDNAIYCNNPGKGRGRFKVAAAKHYGEEVQWLMRKARIPRKNLRARWYLYIVCEMDRSTFAKRDLSNCFKCLLDAMATYLETDDRFLIQLNTRKSFDTGRNQTRISLTVEPEEEWLARHPEYYKKTLRKQF